MLMLKARHGWTNTSFDLMSVLGDTYPDGNKVPANTYRAKKLIRPVAMKLRKFDACPNHCTFTKESSMRSWRVVHTATQSRYKRNAGCRVDANDEGPVGSGPKKKKVAKKKQISAQLDEEEVGYMQRKSPALSMWYLPVIDRLRAIFRNPEDANLMSWHASDDLL
jgi:hypothetical protein